MITIKIQRSILAVFLGASAATLSVATVTDASSAEAVGPSTSVVTRTTPPTVATQAQLKALTIKKYGVFPLPVSLRNISRYHLRKKQIIQIEAARRLANTRHARRVRWCESNDQYKIVGNGYYGAWQFDHSTWLSNGGGRYARTANRAPRFAHDHIMWKTHRARGWSPWACA